jgi:hypothetical protein
VWGDQFHPFFITSNLLMTVLKTFKVTFASGISITLHSTDRTAAILTAKELLNEKQTPLTALELSEW